MRNFTEVLEKRGHQKLLPRIVAELEKAQAAEIKKRGITVKVANEEARAPGLTKARTLAEGKNFALKDIQVIEDDTLIAGYIVEGPGFRYDTSARAALKSLYTKLTST